MRIDKAGLREAAVPLLGFVLFLWLIRNRSLVDPILDAVGAAHLGDYGRAILINIVPVAFSFLALAIQQRSVREALELVGMNSNPIGPICFGFIATAPALIGFLLTAHLDRGLTAYELILKGAFFPFCEEFLFRAIAFGLLYRLVGLSFWPAAILPAVVFAASHVHGDTPPGEVLGLLAVTGVGGVLFSFLLVRFGWSLWAPAALHGFLNTWWSVFQVSHNALGGWSDNVFRLLAIITALLISWFLPRSPLVHWMARRNGWWRSSVISGGAQTIPRSKREPT